MVARVYILILLLVAFTVDTVLSRSKIVQILSKVNVPQIKIALESSVSIEASPSLLNRSGEWVHVVFSGIPDPDEGDWIGVYSPPGRVQNAPIKFKFANVSKGYLNTGSGSLSFQLINMRAAYGFIFFRNGTDYPVAIGFSNAVEFRNYNEPLQGHLANTDTWSSLRISWNNGENEGDQIVKWGTQSKHYTESTRANTSTYRKKDMCGPIANSFGWREPGYQHTAVMRHFLPNTRYYYTFGNDRSGFSEEYSFVSPPLTHSRSNVSLVAFGDMGKGEVDGSEEHWLEKPSLQTTANILSILEEINLVLHIGDISYAVGYSSQWDSFMQQIEPIATRVSYMTLPGNHERDYPNSGSYYNGTDSGGECGVPYDSRFPMPGYTPAKPYYSFDYGNIHFLMMSTESDFTLNSKQYYFIANDLARVDRTKTPWIIFSGHRPMYVDSKYDSSTDADQPVAKLLRQSIEPLLLKFRVNLCLWGHHHSYQRSCPVYQENCQNKSSKGGSQYPIHVIIGMAGQSLTQNLEDKLPPWMVIVDNQEYGYSRIFTNESTLHFQYFSNYGNVLRDEFYIHAS